MSAEPRSVGPGRLAWRRFRRRRTAWVGAGLVTVLALCGLLAPLLAPYSYETQFRESWAEGPGPKHWLGVDPLARDVLSRILYGARVSLQVAVAATLLSVLVGVLVGGAAGYLGGWTDEVLMRVADTFSAFPGILLAVGVAAAFQERSLVVVFIALGLVGWTTLAWASAIAIPVLALTCGALSRRQACRRVDTQKK